MCLQLPCGYSSQTLTKIIAWCKILIYSGLIATTVILALILETQNSAFVIQDEGSAHNLPVTASEAVETKTSKEESFTTEITTTQNLEDGGANNTTEPNLEHDLMQFMEASHIIRACFILWIVVNFVSGLTFSIVLLQGAQERNLFKVKTWFFVTIISYLLWIPIYAYFVCHAEEPVNVLVSGFMIYMLGGLCLWVVSGFIEELRIESISHRVGYKDMLVPFYKI